MERGWLERALDGLPAGAAVMDLGCGSGRPIAAWLHGQGYAVTGVDVSAEMLALAKGHLPDVAFIEADMRHLALGKRYDAIIAWNSVFHLEKSAQRQMFAIFRDHLLPGGRVLVTTGAGDGEALGHVGDEEVYHASLAPAVYRELMAANGLEECAFVPEDPECGGHSVWLMQTVGDDP